ncbi:MAG: hypothetical protein KGJ13_08140 [Patescibacteria group bacterium]|nr:hypothetical protein [Patescibacteria group bacterium]
MGTDHSRGLFLTFLIGVVVLLIIAFALAIWFHSSSPRQQANSDFRTPEYFAELQKETNALIGTAKFQFPQAVKMTQASGSLPAELAPLPSGAKNIQYEFIAYNQSQRGFYVSYDIPSSTLQSEWTALQPFSQPGYWQRQTSISSLIFAFKDYQNTKTGDWLRSTFSQQGSAVHIVIQSLSKSL